MKDSHFNKIKVEVISFKHLFNLALNGNRKELQLIQFLILKNLIAEIENKLPKNFSSKQSFSLVAIENNKIIAFIILKPINNRGSCWSISMPIIIQEPKFNTLREVKLNLLKASLALNIKNKPNWLLKYPTKAKEELSILRELGFQPHKITNIWLLNKKSKAKLLNYKSFTSSKEFIWERINKKNSNLLCKLESVGEPIVLKSIIDRQANDFVYIGNYVNQIYISQVGSQKIALAGLIKENFPHEQSTLKIVRDISYDLRLNNALLEILKDLSKYNKDIYIEINNNDVQINQLFSNFGLTLDSEVLILSKSIMRRKEFTSSISFDKTMESIIGKITPTNNPLPSPTSIPR